MKVAGNVKNGFTAEFLPEEVGAYTVCVEYNGIPVGGRGQREFSIPGILDESQLHFFSLDHEK